VLARDNPAELSSKETRTPTQRRSLATLGGIPPSNMKTS
jgi:hypothetical protein